MASWVIGADLGGTKIELGLVNPDNQIVARQRIATEPARGPASVVQRIVASVETLKESLPAGTHLDALGICSPGPVDHETGTLIDPPNLAGLHNAPLRQMLENALSIPVSLEHDAKAAALGEFHYGIGRGEHSMVYMVVGTGVGGAIIHEGELLRGLHNSAGEMGHVTLDPNGERCSCGRYGCVETFLSGPYIARYYQTLRQQNDLPPDDIDAALVAQRARQGDPLAVAVMERAGKALGMAVGMTAMLLNIDLFVIGGSVAKSGELLIEPARRALPDHAYRSVGCGVHIVATELDGDGPILGCAWQARQVAGKAPVIEVQHASATLPAAERQRLEAIEGVVFNIQRFSLHDGPGIRTNVFLKGCALRCEWCANPESQQPQPQLALSAQQCIECGQYADACRDTWWDFAQTRDTLDKFGPRTETCPAGAIHWMGERMRAGDVIRQVLRDVPFYGDNGGMTLTGGEPTFQPRMAEALARLAQAEKISVTMETAGHTRWKVFERLLPYLDVILFDIKHVDPVRHKRYTGVDNELILGNLVKLASGGASAQVRVPLIPGFNAEAKDLHAIGAWLARVDGLSRQIGLLPYHTLGRSKYRALARDYPWADQQPLDDDQVQAAAHIFENYGFAVSVGS